MGERRFSPTEVLRGLALSLEERAAEGAGLRRPVTVLAGLLALGVLSGRPQPA